VTLEFLAKFAIVLHVGGSSLISLLVCVVDDLYYQQGDFFQALDSGHSTRLKSFAITS